MKLVPKAKYLKWNHFWLHIVDALTNLNFDVELQKGIQDEITSLFFPKPTPTLGIRQGETMGNLITYREEGALPNLT
jgi:hypothetical protein